MTPQERINATTNLDELAEVLNDLEEELAESQFRVEDVVSLSSLPTFGDVGLEHTSGIFSWDEKRLLVVDEEWKMIPRCECCGEAPFACVG